MVYSIHNVKSAVEKKVESFFYNSEKNPLLILDIANNHNGSVVHGKKIIDEIRRSIGSLSVRAAIKFQYRDLDTFIHPEFKGREDIKYVKRFESTRLTWSDFQELANYARSAGFLTACTPFDEASVMKVIDHRYDILKIASASFTDWPLLEEVAKTSLPIVASTAAASIKEIDRVVTFLRNRGKDFALMHCVAAYPTANPDLQMNRIDMLYKRYEGIPIGYSTHEDPNNLTAVQIAVAKGAQILERHVGIGAPDAPLNDYSSSPDTISTWVASIKLAMEMCGRTDKDFSPVPAELDALGGLRRGAFVKTSVKTGERLTTDNTFFAIPLQDNQIVANEWSKYSTRTALTEMLANEPVINRSVNLLEEQETIWSIVQRARELFRKSGVTLPNNTDLEISHHYGLDKFDETGLLMITVVNREYCKKLLGVLPGQFHPEQYHKKKEESFHCLWGELDLWLDGEHMVIHPGDSAVVQPGVRHKFSSNSGCVIEEISATHFMDDSYYTDESISKNPNRKTFISFWT